MFDVNSLLQCKAATQNAQQGGQLIRHKGLQFWCSLILLKYIIICFPILMQCLLLFNWNGFCSALLQNKAVSDFQVTCPKIHEMWKHIWQWKNQAAEPPVSQFHCLNPALLKLFSVRLNADIEKPLVDIIFLLITSLFLLESVDIGAHPAPENTEHILQQSTGSASTTQPGGRCSNLGEQ